MKYLQSYKIFEGRVPRDERIQVYKDENIIILLPLTHRALQKYASGCAWCINSDEYEWKEYHEGDTLIIIQRNPKQVPYGITENPTDEEIYTLDAYEDGRWGWDDVKHSLLYDFEQDEEKALEYFTKISKDINNFDTNIIYYNMTNGVMFDKGNNNLDSYHFTISDIPNVTPEVINIIKNYKNDKNNENI